MNLKSTHVSSQKSPLLEDSLVPIKLFLQICNVRIHNLLVRLSTGEAETHTEDQALVLTREIGSTHGFPSTSFTIPPAKGLKLLTSMLKA